MKTQKTFIFPESKNPENIIKAKALYQDIINYFDNISDDKDDIIPLIQVIPFNSKTELHDIFWVADHSPNFELYEILSISHVELSQGEFDDYFNGEHHELISWV